MLFSDEWGNFYGVRERRRKTGCPNGMVLCGFYIVTKFDVWEKATAEDLLRSIDISILVGKNVR
jgi:hypothetical protein